MSEPQCHLHIGHPGKNIYTETPELMETLGQMDLQRNSETKSWLLLIDRSSRQISTKKNQNKYTLLMKWTYTKNQQNKMLPDRKE
jgi:hypothetical protein